MKTFKNLILCLLLMFPLATNMSLFAQEIPNDEIWYEASEKLPEVTDWWSSSGGLHTNAFNTTIASHTFANGKGIIKFNGNVTSIGNYAFKGCYNLTSITIPDLVVNVGNEAFSNCNLSLIVIPQSVTSIGSNPFTSNKNLALIVVDVANSTFDSRNNCNAIIRKSDNMLIVGCKNTVIPNSVESIGEKAFYSCLGLKSIEIPNSVRSIGSEAFHYCSDITSVIIGKSVVSIGNEVFRYCSNLVTIDIPDSVKNIGYSVFAYCSNLTSATIGNSVTALGDGEFFDCSSLASITIPNSLTSIGNRAFEGNGKLSAVYISSLDSWCRIKFGDNPVGHAHKLYLNNEELKDVRIPSSVDSISNYAFNNCSNFTSITLPTSVKYIGEGAFRGCTNLTSICMSNNITKIGNAAFCDCSNLTSFTIPNTLMNIGSEVFRGCEKLASITIPKSVTSIGEYAFGGCSALNSINNLATRPQEISSNSFPNYSATLHVYEGLKGLYQVADFWRNFTISDDLPTVKATSLQIDASIYYCQVYGKVTPSATVNSEATIKDVIWTSNDPSILTIVNENTGNAIGLKEGVATITASTIDGSQLSASATVYVGNYTPVTSITLNQTTSTLNINETLSLTATVLPENATAKNVRWTSSNTAIASISLGGVVTAMAPGIATITATSVDGTNITATCEITVSGGNFVYVDVDGEEINQYIKNGDIAEITDSYKRLNIKQEISNVNVTYTRNFSSAMVDNWQAWYMPCDFAYDDLSEDFDVAMVAGVLFDKEGENYVAFKKMTDGTVKAHTPYVVRAKSSGEVSINTTTTLMPTADAESFSIQSAFHNFIFNGVYENTIVSAANIYALNEQGSFVKQNTGSTISPFRIQLLLTERKDNPYVAQAMPQEVKIMILDEETGIEDVDADAVVDGEIYNLAGQKLQKPQKGINIINGKKVLF